MCIIVCACLLSGLHNQHSMVFSSKGFNQGQEQHQLCLMNNVDTDIYRHGYYLHGYLAARESAVSGQHGSTINTPFYCDPRYVHHHVGLSENLICWLLERNWDLYLCKYFALFETKLPWLSSHLLSCSHHHSRQASIIIAQAFTTELTIYFYLDCHLQRSRQRELYLLSMYIHSVGQMVQSNKTDYDI